MIDTKETVSIKNIIEAVYERLEDILDENRGETEQTIVNGAVFFILAAKFSATKREQVVEMAKNIAIQIRKELKKPQPDEEDSDEPSKVPGIPGSP